MTISLREAVAAKQEELRTVPESRLATFRTESNQIEGLRSETRIRQFSITVDEPVSLGGTDAGPNPVELVIAALASCQEITYRAYAEALGIPLESVSVNVEGELDLRGFYAVEEGVRAGYQGIRVSVNLKSSASEEDLLKLKEIVDAHCPVLDILTNPTPVAIELKTEPLAAAAE
jgi:uncharacterized OsmC-like protein